MATKDDILDGKVTGITTFGAFVQLTDGRSGLVHISEVSDQYVKEVKDFLQEGQEVKVMVIGVDGGKINLSIKRLEARPPRENTFRSAAPRREGTPQGRPARSTPTPPPAPKTADQLFEEKLKAFMSESDSKISSLRQYSDHRTKSRRR